MTFAIASVQSLLASRAGRHNEAVELAWMSAATPNAHFNIVAIAAVVNALAERKQASESFLSRIGQVTIAVDVVALCTLPFRPNSTESR